MPAFALVHAPRPFTRPLRCEIDAPLPIQLALYDAASARCLSPVTLSAQDHSTSELLRTLSGVAASRPTSWLSGQSHSLYHSASNLGPWLAFWAVSLSSRKLIPHGLPAALWSIAIRGLADFGKLVGP